VPFSNNSLPRGSVRVRVGVWTPRRGSVRVRTPSRAGGGYLRAVFLVGWLSPGELSPGGGYLLES